MVDISSIIEGNVKFRDGKKVSVLQFFLFNIQYYVIMYLFRFSSEIFLLLCGKKNFFMIHLFFLFCEIHIPRKVSVISSFSA